MAEIVITYV